MLTQNDLDELEKRFVTKDYLKESLTEIKSDILNKLDDFVKKVRDSHEERTIISDQILDLTDRVEKLEASQTN